MFPIFSGTNTCRKTENRKQRTDIAIRPLSSVLRPLKVGFPIRKFTDQSLFAAPHDLSQRTTSFFASQRQGIHQIPLRHLIALITNAQSPRRRRDHSIPLPSRPSDVRFLRFRCSRTKVRSAPVLKIFRHMTRADAVSNDLCVSRSRAGTAKRVGLL